MSISKSKSSGHQLVLAGICAVLVIFAYPGAAFASEAAHGEQADDEAARPLKLLISLADQRMDVYRGVDLIDSTPVSSGRRGHATPPGIYSVLQKRKWHRSNLYSAAPMPYMQRITWSGLALHQGHLPGYPASHGCIRLGKDFARNLFSMTEIGADVVVTASKATPNRLTHPLLASLTDTSTAGKTRIASLGTSDGEALALASATTLDASETADPAHSTSPLRILITWRSNREQVREVQELLAQLGHDPGELDGYMGPDTARAIRSFEQAIALPPTGKPSDELVTRLYEATGRDRFDGHLYVRQDYVDLFDVPVLIDGAGTELGTHMLTLDQHAPDAIWSALTFPGHEASGAQAALSRVTISATVRQRIARLLATGSTLVISDSGLGRETGKGTDFIVQPR